MPDEKLQLSSLYGEMLNNVRKNTDGTLHHEQTSMYDYLLNKTYDEYKNKVDNMKKENKEKSKGRGNTIRYFFCDEDLEDTLFISESMAKSIKCKEEVRVDVDTSVIRDMQLEKGDKIVGRYGEKSVVPYYQNDNGSKEECTLIPTSFYKPLSLTEESKFIDSGNLKGFKAGEIAPPPITLDFVGKKTHFPLYWDVMCMRGLGSSYQGFDQMISYHASRQHNPGYRYYNLKAMTFDKLDYNKRFYGENSHIEDFSFIPYDPFVPYHPTIFDYFRMDMYKNNKYSFEYHMMNMYDELILFHDMLRKYIEYRTYHSIDYDLLLIYKVGGNTSDGKQQVDDTTNVQCFNTKTGSTEYSRPWFEGKGVSRNLSPYDSVGRMGGTSRRFPKKKQTRPKKFH